MRNLFLSALFAFSVFVVHAQNDVPVNPNFTWNGEISLAVDPSNTAILVAAWMKLTSLNTVSIAISRSSDHGNTWQAPVYMPHFSSSFTSADPALIASSDGTLFFAYIDYNNITLSEGAVYITKSTDGGASWSVPVLAIDASAAPDIPIDRPWLAVDNSNGPSKGTLYLVTKSIKQATVTHHIYLIRSSDEGVTWETPKILDDSLPVGGTANTMGVPCVSADGVLFVNYLSYDISQNLHVRDVFVKSDDGGQTFTTGIISELPFSSAIPPGDSLYQYSYHLAANPADSTNLIHILTDRREGDWDIWVNVSQDGGATWSTTARLNDDPVGNGKGQDMCWGGFSGKGTYSALWRDRRNGTSEPNSDYRIYGSYSTDKGVTFSPNFALSQTPGSLFTGLTGNDFLGASLSDSAVYGTWADKRSGQNQEYFNFHMLPPVSGIRDVAGNSQLQIIPSVIRSSYAELNPGYLKENTKFQVAIYDLPGRCILRQENKSRIELGALLKGMYILGFIKFRNYTEVHREDTEGHRGVSTKQLNILYFYIKKPMIFNAEFIPLGTFFIFGTPGKSGA
ncbi:MAG: sialidase family protein [Bacteroidetes bacterium]|nr:sialidase family protein [Bacteroidota bacterium]